MGYSVVTDRIFRLRHKSTMLLFILSGFMHSETHAADRINSPDQNNISPYQRVKQAGYTLKKKRVNTLTLSYAEGPDNGPPLVLLHAQLLDWFSYYPVLPELSKFFHVYDIDYPGHGQTVTPPDYPMTALQIGSDLSEFIQQTIKEPVYISGNSSGGLLAVWLAANRPQQIMSAILEDPPLFSSEYPRIKQTIAYRAFETSFTAVTQDHPVDFLLYWIHHNAQFFRKNIGPGTPFLLTQAVRAYRWRNPGTPVTLDILSNDTVRMLIRGLDQYDPRFGAAFYDGSWNRGFSHAEALARIRCPVMLIQANYSVLKDGTLDGAMSKEEAMRAMSLLRKGTYLRINATHVVNIDKPDEFIRAIKKFLLEKG
ncbi:Alpha/beta hydrolase fold protein [Sodalis praecaptivus]|uniref:Alpha/beta hydrolase fold protein n=1 Tax=Sodalis praecaptivus TaxID=1239307 RepID=W0HTD5_9GAMM|nr:alpha/beta hydrolase [Sodalis praecaptivus]AHF77019.1 Alpha/beta hydrolase fold protein [Sodalis praecaptivus]